MGVYQRCSCACSLKYQAISIHGAEYIFNALEQFHAEILQM